MKKFIIEESEIKRILSMHRIIKEQTEPVASAAGTSAAGTSAAETSAAETSATETSATETSATGTSDVDPLELLKDSVRKGCLTNGKIYINNTKKTYFYRGVKQSTNQEIDFFPDMTYSFVDGTKKGKWKCDDVTSDINEFEKISQAQTINKSICKNAIKVYYDAYKTKKDFPQAIFDRNKKVVQSCVNTYEGKWGGLLGLGKIKDYVETLRGGIGGPSRRGEDSKWRLN
jgi:hypothetical protein